MATDEKLLKYLKRVTAELHDLRKQGAKHADEPLAIVGMACKVPGGASTPEDLWKLVVNGVDALSEFPTDRGWDLDGLFDPDPDSPGTTYASQGGFLDGAGLFDAGFFGISPREALMMDPQQRLLLEASWEALEDAGVDPFSLKGNDVGVFSGLFTQGYGTGAGVVPPELEGYAGTGSASSVASGRVSYVFGFEGPAVTVDTACSSSLVAIHLAAQALRLGECSMALAGGATVMPTPGTFVAYSRQRVMARDGRSKAFSSTADGTGWAEGLGVVVLERLSVARERGHRILAVLRGSAVNQDGASNGLTAPNGPSQQRVIRKALAGAGLVPSDVDIVEAHGTGTALGDPIEAQALLATYGQGRDSGRPLWLGSVKSNVGHTQAAAGVVGLIKMVKALEHGVMPPTLHVAEPTPEVDWSAGAVELLTQARDWPGNGRPRRAAVSAFGISGTNAHVILEEAPPQKVEQVPIETAPDGAVPLVVSARNAASLAAQAKRLAAFVESGDVSLARVARALVSSRAAFGERAVVVAGSDEQAVAGLGALARGASAPGLVTGHAGAPGKVVWVFPGQGSQRVGMGRELYERYPVFAAALDEACTALDECLAGWVDHPVRDVALGTVAGSAELLDLTVFTQAALFAVESALFRLLASWGVRPDLVIGHSIGEITAAYAAGALSLPDAARVVAARGRLMQALPPDGVMVAVAAGEDDVAGLLGDGVELAAVNGPAAVVLSGEHDAVLAAADRLRERGHKTKRLVVSHAFHSSRMEPMLADLAAEITGVTWRAPQIPVISNVTGRPAEPGELADPRYWTEHVRRPVRFAEGIAAAVAHGGAVFVELGPGAALTAMVEETAAAGGATVTCVAALRDDRQEEQTLLASLAELFVRGMAVDWDAVLPAATGWVDLPTYAFDRQNYWLPATRAATDATSLGQAAADHPLLGAVVRLPRSDGLVFTSRLSLRTHPWLADHAIGGVVLVAGTGLVELAVRAGDEAGCPVLEELVIEAPLVVPEHGGVRVQVAVGAPGDTGARTVDVYSLREDQVGDEVWTRHATGFLAATPPARGAGYDFTAWPPPGGQRVEVGDFYADLADRGYAYGPVFQGLRAVWRRGDEVFAEVALPETEHEEAGRFGLHPGLLDSGLHAGMLNVAATPEDELGPPALPFAWNGLVLHAAGAAALRVRLAFGGPNTVSLEAADETGGLVVSAESLVSRPVSAEQLDAAAAVTRDALFRLAWTELSPAQGDPAPSWVPVTAAADVAQAGAVAVYEVAGGADTPLDVTSRALDVVQAWLAGGPEESRLVVVTRGAVPAGDGVVTDPAGAAVWGLVRSAQAENPDRFVLLDLDQATGLDPVLGSVLASGEPQVAVRGATLSAPRLARVERPGPPARFGPEGTVLISGAGSLGALVARHLVARHDVRRLVLASRRGRDAEGMDDLLAELSGQGAEVSAVACNLSDRDQVATLLDEYRPAAVVHTAGVLDDGVIEALTPRRLAAVFAPKVDAVRHLDELTRGMDLDAFVVFSAGAGVFGSAGQGNYAAANAYLDAAVANRRAAGLPATALAWGMWEQADGMTAHLGEADQARASRGGVLPISPAEGMELFDAGVGAGAALVVPVKLDLRSAGARGDVPHLLRGLVRAGRQQARAAAAGNDGLVHRLAGLAAAEQETLLLDLVRGQVAVVLGHTGPDGVREDTVFSDAGFDSLTSVELRNRLREATGLKLPATLVFDYPTPLVLARHLRDELGDTVAGTPVAPAVVSDPDEPIAIVGMACRLPGGVTDPEDLWRLVFEGREGMSPFPDDRGWDLDGLFDSDPDHAGTSYASQGGFLPGAALFDAGFFGISPREARAMDPQQRLLLEASWEALEGVGIDPVSLKGTDVGVFAGVSNQGYGMGADPQAMEGYASTAGASSVASGRVSYVFGFEGPAVTIDTACSSSLVSMHLAAQALRSGECSMALAGGATVMGTPGTFVEFSRQRGLAGDGRCKSYADGADGTGWSEGVGIVVLERLSVARERGHRILAVLRGSAVNQDGASNGLTAPNGPSQQRVIRRALAGAGLSPSDVDIVEGHGTGTALGDPIEAQALLATYGRDRDAEQPLWLGALKSNIGHTQSAAGVASVIKMVKSLEHGMMPPTLHVDEPTSQVDWSAGAVELLTQAREWPRNGRPRRAGVSSFGISGTNAHLIIEEAPLDQPGPAASGPPASGASQSNTVVALTVSARSAGSLAGQAGRLASLLESGDVPLADVAGALVSGRSVFGERAVVVAGSRADALAGLGALARGAAAPGLVVGRMAASGLPGKLVWVFPGQGSQWAGMGRELLDSSPVFAERIADCAAALDPWIDWSLLDVLRGETDPALMERVDVLQPASFAVMIGLAAVWSSVGVRPDAVLGHSQGEIAAACVAGALSLQDAARVVALRSQAIATKLSGRGGMASVALAEDDVATRLAPWAGRVEVAAVNSASSVVIAGEAQVLDEALDALSGDGVRVRRVAVDYASHTCHVDDIRDTLAEVLAGIDAQAPVVPFYSTVTGDWITDAGVVDGGYWFRNLRDQVGFGPAVASLTGQGHGVFVEVSAHPVLVQPITESTEDIDAVVVGSLRRDEGGPRRLLTSMAELFVRGVPVDWSGVLPRATGRVDLPTYAFDHRHFWLHAAEPATDAVSLGLAGADHPMLGAVVQLPQSDGLVFTSRLSLRSHPWLADHAVRGVVIVSGTGLVELAVRAGDEAGCSVLDELVIEAPLVVPRHGGVRVQVALGGPAENGSRTVEVYSLREDTGADSWTRHASGVLAATAQPSRGTGFDFAAWPPPGAQPVDIGGGYEQLAEVGYEYGPTFQAVRAVWRRGDGDGDGAEIFAEVALPEDRQEEAGGFGIHPALLDAALHSTILSAAADADRDDQELSLPFAWNGLRLHAAGAGVLRVRVAKPGPDAMSLEAVDQAGGLVVTMDSLVGRPVTNAQLATAAGTARADSLFQVDWTALPAVAGEPAPSWVPVADAEQVATLADDVLSGLAAPAAAVLEAVGGDAQDVLELTTRVLDALQCWLAGGGLEESRLVIATRGAVPAGDGTVADPAAAAVWGLVRAAQAENPGRIVLVDLDPAAHDGPQAVLGAVLACDEPQVAVRGEALSVPRLTRVTVDLPGTPAIFSPQGTVLVTGGTGSLGGLVARHLVTGHGVRRLVLASRRGPDAEGVRDLVADLTAQGAAVSVVACDMADRGQVAALLAEHRPTAVVHTAGISDAGVIGTVTPDRLAEVFAPKVDAVRHLDELTRGTDLDAFVVYSSVSGVFMGAGSGSYAAANAFLDGLMARRRAAGLPGLSLAWGLWEQSTGMAAGTDDLARSRMNRRGGLLPMAPAEGMALFDAAVGSRLSLLVPAKLDLRGVRAEAAAGAAVPHLLRGLVRAVRQSARTTSVGDERGRLAERLAGLPAAEQKNVLLDLVRVQVAAVLGYAANQHIEADQGLFEIGFDSLTAIELRNRLRDITDQKIAPNLVFAYPTPEMLAAHLHELMCGEQAAAPVAISV